MRLVRREEPRDEEPDREPPAVFTLPPSIVPRHPSASAAERLRGSRAPEPLDNFTLSLGPRFTYQAYSLEGFAFGLNYGYDRVRFPAPLPVDSRVRMRATLTSVDDVPGGIQMKVTQTFEVEGGEKPVCVAEQLVRLYSGG